MDKINTVDSFFNFIICGFIGYTLLKFIEQFLIRFQLIRMYGIQRPFTCIFDLDVSFIIIITTFLWNSWKPSLLSRLECSMDEKEYLSICGINSNSAESLLIWSNVHNQKVFKSFTEYCGCWNANFMIITVLFYIRKIIYVVLVPFCRNPLWDLLINIMIGSLFYSTAVLSTTVSLGTFSIQSEQFYLITFIYWWRIGMLTQRVYTPEDNEDHLLGVMTEFIKPTPGWQIELYEHHKHILDEKFGFEIGMMIRQYLNKDWQQYDNIIILSIHQQILIHLKYIYGKDIGSLLYSFVYDDLSKLR